MSQHMTADRVSRAYELFGDQLPVLLNELNARLAA